MIGNGGPATAGALSSPTGVALSPISGALFITEYGDHAVRVLLAGTLNHYAGTSGVQGWSGDGGAATAAKLFMPALCATTKNGDLYVADSVSRGV